MPERGHPDLLHDRLDGTVFVSDLHILLLLREEFGDARERQPHADPHAEEEAGPGLAAEQSIATGLRHRDEEEIRGW